MTTTNNQTKPAPVNMAFFKCDILALPRNISYEIDRLGRHVVIDRLYAGECITSSNIYRHTDVAEARLTWKRLEAKYRADGFRRWETFTPEEQAQMTQWNHLLFVWTLAA